MEQVPEAVLKLLKEIRDLLALAEGTTPGPWAVGMPFPAPLREGERCPHCDHFPLLSVIPPDRVTAWYGKDHPWAGKTLHVHADPEWWREIVSLSTGETVVGMYDYEEGGVARCEADAHLIAALPRMLDVLRKLLVWLGETRP